LFIISITLLSNPCFAQWRNIANFIDSSSGESEFISDVYFIDHPGPPRVGFVGTNLELWKTTNGGTTWFRPQTVSPPDYVGTVTDIFFKDSLTGWFTTQQGYFISSQGCPICYRTTDGGNSWQPLYAPGILPVSFGSALSLSIHYSSVANRLTLSSILPADTSENAISGGAVLLYSTDLGNTWNRESQFETTLSCPAPGLSDLEVFDVTMFGSMSFWSDTDGIISSYSAGKIPLIDTDPICHCDSEFIALFGPYYRTMDGGVTWFQADSLQSVYFAYGDPTLDSFYGTPRAIPGTPICFATRGTDYETEVYRSDNYGETWRQIFAFPFDYDTATFTEIAPSEDDYIYGDLTHLYISSDSGIFVSTDQGITWALMSGTHPGYGRILYFYCLYHGEVFANMLTDDVPGGSAESGGLWEEDTGAVAGVAEQEPSPTTLSVFPNPATSSITLSSTNGPISILDPLGRVYKVPQSGNMLDISSLPSGVYFITDGYSRSKFVKE
jgi:Secretion system C-terminal sorting domain/BNR/Asp-box repeat